MQPLTNSHLKYLAQLRLAKNRNAEGLFCAEGPKLALEYLSRPVFEVIEIVATETWFHENQQTVSSFLGQKTIASAKQMGRISNLKTASEVYLLCRKSQEKMAEVKGNTAFYLDDVQDPGNVGTIIRIADWYGIPTVIRSHKSADFYSPKVVQSAMASNLNVALHSADIEEVTASFEWVGTTLDGEEIEGFSWPEKTLIVLGNESKGISPRITQMLSRKVRIGGSDSRVADSLNVAIAAGIVANSWFTNMH